MPAAILGTSIANGDWHGFGTSGWWIETAGPTSANPSAPRAYDQSLPSAITGISVYCPTTNYSDLTVPGADGILTSLGWRSAYCSVGSPTQNQLTITATGSYRGLIRLDVYSARSGVVKILKADGTTLLDALSLTLPPCSWLAWEANETIVLSLEGSFIRYQGILFDGPRRAWLAD